MSWFDTAGIASFAKSALTTAQKTIDKALDIQEETTRKVDKKSADSENFFEAFGLSDKPSVSATPSKQPKSKTKEHSDSPDSNLPVQVSGFWTEAWGSFFEPKDLGAVPLESKPTEAAKDDNSKEIKHRIEATVLSQPHRASLFPAESHPVQLSSHSEDNTDQSNAPSLPGSLPDINVQKSDSAISSTESPIFTETHKFEDCREIMVTEKSSNESGLCSSNSNDVLAQTDNFNSSTEAKKPNH
ncbi:TATA element modulatory factor [Trichonephila clavata]|uniref:TATA element modulatory factor n=1 Tax=Trichonephila clavata TaxID=2740835 RepID=A0A8X6L5H2_TRICU|nr:TATA element modulatory factor [Trichonephila clavata]